MKLGLSLIVSALFILTASSLSAKTPADSLGAYLGTMDMLWDNNITADPVIAPGQSRRHWGRTTGYYAGALMGNGLLGTNLYKLEDGVYRLNVGRSDVTETKNPYNVFNRGRLPIGYFTISPSGKVLDEKMSLSIYDAETAGCFTTDKGKFRFKTYVHAEKDLVVFVADPSEGEKNWKLDFVPQEAISPRHVFGHGAPEGYVNKEGHSNPPARRIVRKGVNCLVQPLASDTTFTSIVRCYVVAWKTSGNRTVATVSQETTEEAAVGKAVELVRKALGTPEKKLEREHLDWWHEFYRKAASLNFPDKDIEKFYWFQYYKFACCARPGKPIVDLQGVWPTVDTPWPAIWMNLNIQLTYSWLTKANLGFLAQPLWDSFWEHRDNLTRNVTDIPGQEDWTDSRVMPRSSGYDLLAPLDPSLASVNLYEVGNFTWTLFYYWQQCEAYGDDFQMKNRLFPLLKSAVNIFFHISTRNPDGSWTLPSTASPEYFTDRPIGPDSNYDLANLRWGLETLISLDDRYGLDDPMRPEWEDFLRGMPSFRYDEKTGFKLSELYEFTDTTHRHYSHLFMIYPYHFLDWDNPEDAAKMQLSLSRWNGNTGYSLTGKASMLESGGDGDGALALLKKFFASWVRRNTLYNESGPVIETPFSAMCALEEMYIQDWGDVIRVFPACPTVWKDCSFENMRAKGAFLVSAERRDGKTVSVRVCSEKGGVCRLKVDGQLYEFEMQAGETRDVKLLRPLPVIPYPAEVTYFDGVFDAEGAAVHCDALSGREQAAVNDFAASLKAISSVREGETSAGSGEALRGRIVFHRDTTLGEEAYRIEVGHRQIDVSSSAYSGTFYALRTLEQLLPTGIYGPGIRKALSPEGARRFFAPGSEHAAVKDAVLVRCGREGVGEGSWEIPCMIVEDSPRFSYRGASLDCSRHFFTVESVKNFLRVMSFYKLNRFHWHLTNDAGWRAEIRKYPRLTREGAFRGGIMTNHVHGLWRGGSYGGFYTQDEMREIVRYADSLAITIVPEVCIPSHIESALAAYPELGCTGGPYQLRNKIGVYPEILCAGKESSFEFIENVLDELCGIFPGEYFHIGGDECLKTRWEQCPLCQAEIRRLGLEDSGEWKAENFLQSHVTRRVQEMLAKRGRKLIGWDEILEGDLDSGATVMSWRGVSGGIKAARKGMDVIMAPTGHCYFDYIQTDMPELEPPSISSKPLPVENVYSFNPSDGLTPDEARFVKGVECELWTEYIVTENHLQYMALPRMMAVSEVQWCEPRNMDYSRFRHDVVTHQFPLLRGQGYVFCKKIEE